MVIKLSALYDAVRVFVIVVFAVPVTEGSDDATFATMSAATICLPYLYREGYQDRSNNYSYNRDKNVRFAKSVFEEVTHC
jgi:hypothetical protein